MTGSCGSPESLLLPIAEVWRTFVCDEDVSNVKACEDISARLGYSPTGPGGRARRWAHAIFGNRASMAASPRPRKHDMLRGSNPYQEFDDMAHFPDRFLHETLLDLRRMEPTFARIFGTRAPCAYGFSNLILYSAALTVAGCYLPFTDIGAAGDENAG